MSGRISKEMHRQIAAYTGVDAAVDSVSLDELIGAGTVPAAMHWTPTLCLSTPEKKILVHLLETEEIPSYVLTAAAELKSANIDNVDVVVVATSVHSHSASSRISLRPAWAAGNVAEVCRQHGIGLEFVENKRAHVVFPPRYISPAACANSEETGHIPRWLYEKLLGVQAFSPYLGRVLKKFVRTYTSATKGKSINYDKEVDILRKLARDISKGDPRLFIPVGQLDVLREWERAGANKKSRDHFFHTFNNLLMGFFILGSLKRPTDKTLGAVDDYIAEEKGSQPQLALWESLWLLTCLFHDPAYIAENFHSGTFRFSYGVVEDESGFGAEIQEAQKDKIVDLWNTEFVTAREYLGDLYAHSIRKWSPPGVQPLKAKDFDSALRKAYFDGIQCSHSLISGIRLIQLCRTDRVADTKRRREPAIRACVIAALGMMFHDQKCRDTLRAAGVQPFAFSKLPYASVLMFADSLQDDRRDISRSRFPAHGVLADLRVEAETRTVSAAVCLPEVDFKLWAGRIAEYENVMAWVNESPTTDVKFHIDYRTRAKL